MFNVTHLIVIAGSFAWLANPVSATNNIELISVVIEFQIPYAEKNPQINDRAVCVQRAKDDRRAFNSARRFDLFGNILGQMAARTMSSVCNQAPLEIAPNKKANAPMVKFKLRVTSAGRLIAPDIALCGKAITGNERD